MVKPSKPIRTMDELMTGEHEMEETDEQPFDAPLSPVIAASIKKASKQAEPITRKTAARIDTDTEMIGDLEPGEDNHDDPFTVPADMNSLAHSTTFPQAQSTFPQAPTFATQSRALQQPNADLSSPIARNTADLELRGSRLYNDRPFAKGASLAGSVIATPRPEMTSTPNGLKSALRRSAPPMPAAAVLASAEKRPAFAKAASAPIHSSQSKRAQSNGGEEDRDDSGSDDEALQQMKEILKAWKMKGKNRNSVRDNQTLLQQFEAMQGEEVGPVQERAVSK